MIDVRQLIEDNLQLLVGGNTQRQLFDIVRQYKKTSNEDVRYDTGISKFVFLGSDEDDFVLKINTSRFDYCNVEAELCQKAKAHNLQKMFAFSEMYASVGTVKIYKQEKVSEIAARRYSQRERQFSRVEMATIQELYKDTDFYITCEPWLLDALDYYGVGDTARLMMFLKHYKVNDLHNENVGYIGDRPILLDYSGYRGPDGSS